MGPKVKPKTIINTLTGGKPNIDQMPLISIDELTTPFKSETQKKREATAQKRYEESYAFDPEGHEDLENWLRSQKTDKYPLSTQPFKSPIKETKPVVFNRPSVDTKKTGDINWDKVLGKKILTNEEIIKYTDNELKQIYKLNPDKNPADRAAFTALTNQARGLYQKDPENFFTNLINRDKKLISNLDEALETYTPGLKELYDVKDRLTSKGSKTREKLLTIARKFFPNASEEYINKNLLDFAHVFGFKQTGDVNRKSKFLDIGGSPDVMYLSPSYANRSIQRSLEGQIKKLITANRTKPNVKLEESVQRLQNLLEKIKPVSYITMKNKDEINVSKFGYDAKETVGKYKAPRFTDDELEELFEYLLEAQPDAKMTLQKKSPYKGILFNEGGLIRPNMALGGDMAQYEQMESVVPDLNPDEAEMQLAMSFKNPFKLKKQPPLIDEVDTTLKISDQGPGTSKTATQTHTLDAGVGSDSIFYLKSDAELANAVQNKMTPQQWLGYLTKKGVSPTELDEFGLKNLIYRMGGWDESTKKWTNNKAISKSDLIAAYKNEKPIISYKIHQIEPFEKGVTDFNSFLNKRKSGGSYYHGETAMDDVRGLLNKPQDIAGDTLRLRLSETLKNVSDLKKDWPTSEKAIIADINKTFKQFYGIDDVVKNGIPEGMKIPFYSKNLLDRFNRLRKGEGFYFAKGKGVQHEGTQFMPGGTGYVEIPFTYNPNPKGKRANEPGFTFGEGHFTNPEGNNPVFWMRASERTDEQGNRILFIEEIQSDMHQKVKQKPDTFSYAKRHDTPGMVDRNMALKQIDNLKLELGKVTDQIDKITGHTDPSAATIMERLKVKREAIRNQLSELQNSIQEAAKKDDSLFPEGPFKKSENQTKIALKTAINLATKEGFDGVAIITGKAKNKFANASGEVAKGNLGFYDQIAVKAMKSTAKNLDLDFSATNIKDGEGNTWAKIPVINLKETTINKSVDMYKAEGGYIFRPSFVDVVPTL